MHRRRAPVNEIHAETLQASFVLRPGAVLQTADRVSVVGLSPSQRFSGLSPGGRDCGGVLLSSPRNPGRSRPCGFAAAGLAASRRPPGASLPAPGLGIVPRPGGHPAPGRPVGPSPPCLGPRRQKCSPAHGPARTGLSPKRSSGLSPQPERPGRRRPHHPSSNRRHPLAGPRNGSPWGPPPRGSPGCTAGSPGRQGCS